MLAARRQAEIRRLDAGEDDPSHASQAIGPRCEQLLTRLPGDIDRSGAVSRLTERIQRRVADPRLRRSPALRVARAVVWGELPEAELDAILDDVDAARPKCRSCYFVTCAKNVFKRYELPWPIDGSAAHSQPKERR